MDIQQPKIRVFAGPNGSGKSTVISFIREYKVNDRNVEFGHYINADDIAQTLKNKSKLTFEKYGVKASADDFVRIISNSGLLNNEFDSDQLLKIFKITDNTFHCLDKSHIDRLAQMLADYLRKTLLNNQERFSFETVFSHRSKLDILKEAVKAGYKVYLYFVCTESPEINKFRVKARTKLGGHDVPTDRIESRYYRALDLLHDAAQLAYQAFFFDNSEDGGDFKMFAHFKIIGGRKVWDDIIEEDIPNWFKLYYLDKVNK